MKNTISALVKLFLVLALAFVIASCASKAPAVEEAPEAPAIEEVLEEVAADDEA